MKHTIKAHILGYLTSIKESIGEPTFRTSDIQGLSFQGVNKYGRILGSPSTYERVFRQIRQDGLIKVSQSSKLPNQRQASWIIKEVI
tara:strand:- start:220 stop:480 length:261 start_codon:yes stop_codon:yes gene_type:complete